MSTRNDDGAKPAALPKWRAAVNAALEVAVSAASKGRGFVSVEGIVQVEVCWLSVDPCDHSQPDLDNILKPLIDALNGTIIEDDRQVHRIIAQKANVNSPPPSLEDIMDQLQDDERFSELGELIVVRVGNLPAE